MGLGPLHVMAQLFDPAEIPGWRVGGEDIPSPTGGVPILNIRQYSTRGPVNWLTGDGFFN
jgi:hypothetical protein